MVATKNVTVGIVVEPWPLYGSSILLSSREENMPTTEQPRGGIEFTAATKTYGATTAVAGLNLTIPPAEITVFVGPSGCGKSTSLRMINCMVQPTSGTVSIDGTDVQHKDPYQLRRSIGYVMQSGGLLPHRTVAENIATVPRLNGVNKPEAHAKALTLLETVGLDVDYADRYPASLSGGQAQRVGVARALAADAPIMLMDEPFSAVDPVVRAELQAELLRLHAQTHKTIVFVTHDIDEAILLGDNIAVFAPGGHLAQFGTPEALLTRPASDFVARFLSSGGGVLGSEAVMAAVRAERLKRYGNAR